MSNTAIQEFEQDFIRSFIDKELYCAFGFLSIDEEDIKQVHDTETLLEVINKSQIIDNGYPKLLDVGIISTFRGFKEAFFKNIIFKKLEIRKLILASKELEEKYKRAFEVFGQKHKDYVGAFVASYLKTRDDTKKQRPTISEKKLRKSLKERSLTIENYLSLLEYYCAKYSSFDDISPSEIALFPRTKKEEKELYQESVGGLLKGLALDDENYRASPVISRQRLEKSLKSYLRRTGYHETDKVFGNYSDLEFDGFCVPFESINQILKDIADDKLEGSKIALAAKAHAVLLLDEEGQTVEQCANKLNLSSTSIDFKSRLRLGVQVSKEIIKRKVFCKF